MQPLLQQPLPQGVKVTILLRGGHQYPIRLKPDDPLLRDLVTVLIAHAQGQKSGFNGLFQIPLDQGQASLCFASSDLAGLITEPGVFVQLSEGAATQPTVHTQSTIHAEPRVSAEPVIPSLPEGFIPSDYVQLDNFLSSEEQQSLLMYVLLKESAFTSTSTSTGDAEYRRSMVLYSFSEFFELMTEKVRATLPTVFSKLGMQPFPIADIEAQITAHNDGHYYKVHNDNGSPDAATREFTYVYYFNREPKPFSGGELRIYDTQIENNMYAKAASYHTVEPRNNSIVFFPSRCHHEVLTILCPSKAFVDSRFTVNGWVRRQ